MATSFTCQALSFWNIQVFTKSGHGKLIKTPSPYPLVILMSHRHCLFLTIIVSWIISSNACKSLPQFATVWSFLHVIQNLWKKLRKNISTESMCYLPLTWSILVGFSKFFFCWKLMKVVFSKIKPRPRARRARLFRRPCHIVTRKTIP